MRSTTYFWDYCSFHIPQLHSSGRCKRYVSVELPVHVFNEIIKPNGADFHGNKLIVEEAKTPPRTFQSSNTIIKSSNLLEPLPNILHQEPVNPATSNADKPPIQNVESSCSDAIIPNKKISIFLFVDSTPRGMKMKDIDS